MSQSRISKVPVVGESNVKKPGASVIKGSGDTLTCNAGLRQQRQKGSSHHKIPQKIRYDLENTLLSLCNLWFEDIKPHLVKNNIKLHVHGGGRGPASGDHELAPPAGAAGCSHLDPGAASDQRRQPDASCADCYLMRRMASKVQCPKQQTRLCHSQVSPVAPTSLQITLPNTNPTLGLSKTDCTNRKNNIRGFIRNTKLQSNRKTQQYKTPIPPQSNWRVPRLCRTVSILPTTCTTRTLMPRCQTAIQVKLRRPPSGLSVIKVKRRVRMKHKSTQAGSTARSTMPLVQARPPLDTPCGRCPGTSAIPHMHQSPKGNFHQSRSNFKPLFPKDLVNIIADKHDKKLRLLYRSPQREDSPSVMNLIQTPKETSKKIRKVVKKKPWR